MGRKPKLDAERSKLICSYVQAGATYQKASQAAGVHPSTMLMWLKKGEETTRQPYRKFREDLKRAEGLGVVSCLAVIQKASKRSWQAAAWLLERRFPQEYGRSELRREYAGQSITVTFNRPAMNPDDPGDSIEVAKGVDG